MLTQHFVRDARDIIRGARASLAGAGGRLTARLLLMLAAGNWYGVTALGVLGETAALIEITAAIGAMGLRRALLGIMAGASDERQRLGYVAGAGLLMLILGGLLCALLTWLWPLIQSAGNPAPLAVVLAVPCIMLTEVALAATRFQRVIRWNVLARSIVEPWSFLLLTLIGYFLQPGIAALLWAYMLSLALTMLTALIGVLRVFPPGRWRGVRPDAGNAWRIARISFPTGILEISSMLYRRVDILILGLVTGPAATGVYYMAQQVSTLVHKIHDLFEPMVSPVIAQAISRSPRLQQQQSGIGPSLAHTCRWILTIQIGIAVPLAVFGGGVLDSFGPGFAAGLLAMAILFIGEMADGSSALTELPLVYTRPRIPPSLAVIALLLEITGVYFLSTWLGPAGAAAGFALAMLILAALRLTALHRCFRLRVLQPDILPVLTVGAALGTVAFMLRQALPALEGIWLWSMVLSTLAGYWLLIRRFALSRADIELFAVLRRPA